MNAPWRARRYHPDGVSHLELWCEETASGPLWRRASADRVEALQKEGASRVEVARDLAGALCPVLERVAARLRCEAVYLAGGLISLEGLGDALAEETSLPVFLDPEGRFAGARGGQAVLLRETGLSGPVVDVGQTSVKAACDGRRIVHPRDFVALPRLYIDPDRLPAPDPERGRRAAAFVARACAELSADRDTASVLLALPGPLGDELVPGPCTYGWQGDRSFFPALLDHLGASRPAGGELLVLNDAELAAETARERLRPNPGERVLCVTLGFGPGGALLAPR
jgi:hypothetical protein